MSEQFKICNPDKIEIIPLGFDLDKFRKDTDKKRDVFRKRYLIEDDEIAIGLIGRLVPVKNHHMFLRVLKKLKETQKYKIRAFIVGDGEMKEELKRVCSEYKLEYSEALKERKKTHITFTSWLKEKSFETMV